MFGSLVAPPQELIRCNANVLRNLAEQGRRDVATSVEGNRRPSTISMAELLVGTFLPNLGEAQSPEKGDDLSRL